jgi:uncharacterized protein (TIRG00374 family)
LPLTSSEPRSVIRAALGSWRFWLGVALAAGLLALSVRGVAWSDVRHHLADAEYFWLIPAALTIVAGQVARAARWQALFGDSARPNLRDAFAILSVGYMLSNLLPLRLGDPVRAWLVDTRTPGDGAQALATVVAERVVDLLTILLLLALFLAQAGATFLDEITGGRVRIGAPQLAALVVAGVLAATVALIAASVVAAPAGRAVARILTPISVGRAEWLGAGVTRFLAGFTVLRQPRHTLLIFALSGTVWIIGAVGYWLTARTFGLGLDMSAALFAMCAAALFAAFLPPSPGYVGAFHAAVQRSLAMYAGVTLSAGFALALVLHALTFAMLMAMGLAGLAMLGMSSRSLGESLQAARP